MLAYTTRGLLARTASYPMPSFSATPGRKFSTTTSAVAHSSRASAWASGCLRSSTTLCLLRFITLNSALSPLRIGPIAR